uniref:Prefoldin subunit 1 n=1 Tax=Caenorhabditis tropicalis TaxID=1561998 RepID=A0A1I7UCT8_9PELO
MRISESTMKNLVGLDEGLNYYRSVGRMFLLTDKAAEISRHEAEAKQSRDKIEAIEKQKEYLEKGLVEAESNLRELIQSRR